jgi:hypothetical protein
MPRLRSFVEGDFRDHPRLHPSHLLHFLPIHFVGAFLLRQVCKRASVSFFALKKLEYPLTCCRNKTVLNGVDEVKIAVALLSNNELLNTVSAGYITAD